MFIEANLVSNSYFEDRKYMFSYNKIFGFGI